MSLLASTLKLKICSVSVHLGLVFLLLFVGPASAADNAGLSQVDCGKCHASQVKIMAGSHGPHATQLGCLECHPHHPPTDQETISACVLCHAEQPHYQIGDCQHCHVDPHRPLITLRDSRKPEKKACLSCHPTVGQQMIDSPSRHAQLFCTRCHSRHKQIPDCRDCHDPHQQNQLSADCLKCHPAHQPLRITFDHYLPSGFCRPCHLQQSNALAATRTNHGGISCVYCHKGQHTTSPDCRDCHGLPHTPAIHRRYRDCLFCHGDAHKLISNR
ncbi:MAG: hypothetical protein RBR06_08535 [Desulfuromonadaceae bacterium]|nr:hypothetical protein [Desulfuromonadaceae bacterium]